jgi:archaellum component FlaG (FlaF/FlaG flagellin family)
MIPKLFKRLFDTSWARKPRRRVPNRRHSVTLDVMRLEDRLVLSDLLGTAATFAVLGGSTVTNTGTSVINGDLGVTPGSAVTGFPPGIVVPPGVIHRADAVARQAKSDTVIAYNDLASRARTATLTGLNLGGLTLTPGVYFFAGSAQLTGALTLDFQGNPDALFVFQIGSTLTTATNSSVVMINGGGPLQSCEVYWKVGSSATLGTTTSFVGNIVALTSISLNTGANIVGGRALARNGAVTLDTNVITMPDCVTNLVAGSISGLKYNDANGNGVRNTGELGLQGVTIFLDTDGDGALDPGEEVRITGINGNYAFAGIAAGTFTVRQITPVGMVNTTPNPVTVTVGIGQDVGSVNFGDQVIVIIGGQIVSIRGVKFLDTNGDGIRNPGEPGLGGFTIFLDANNDGVLNVGELRTTTNANGNYTFFNLGPGTFRVREVRILGYIQMTNNPPNLVISILGQNVTASALGNGRVAALVSASKLSLIGSNMLPGVLALQARFVENLYFNLLRRAPDRAGLVLYVRMLQAGYTQAVVTANFRRAFGV